MLTVTSYREYYNDLVKYLIYHHCHSDAKEWKAVVQRGLENGLDFDEAGDLIEEAGGSDKLCFVHTAGSKVWYEQREPVLVYIEEQMDICLELIPEDKFDHLKPPELRNKYDM